MHLAFKTLKQGDLLPLISFVGYIKTRQTTWVGELQLQEGAREERM